MNSKDTYFCMTIERGTKKIRNCHYKHHTLNFSTHNKYKNKPQLAVSYSLLVVYVVCL